MLTCEGYQMLLADSLYERLGAGDQQRLDAHLVECAECQALQRELNDSTLQLRSATDAHRETIPALDDLWTKLEPKLDRIDAHRYRQHFARRGWQRWGGGALALAASLVLAVTVVFQSANQPATPAASPSELTTSLGAPEFESYLDRAQVVMLLLANAEQSGISGMPLDRDYASLMAIEARLLNASLGNQISASEQKLLSDLEFLLVQFANIDDDNLDEGLAMLRLYLQDNTVLFRMNLALMRQALMNQAQMEQQPQVI